MDKQDKINIEDAIKCRLNIMEKLIRHDSFEYSYNPDIGCIEVLPTKKTTNYERSNN